MSSEALERADEMIAALLAEVARLEQAHAKMEASYEVDIAALEAAEAALAVAREREQPMREALQACVGVLSALPRSAQSIRRTQVLAMARAALVDEPAAAATRTCPNCNGFGKVRDSMRVEPVTCGRCDGRGVIPAAAALAEPGESGVMPEARADGESPGSATPGSASAAADEPGESVTRELARLDHDGRLLAVYQSHGETGPRLMLVQEDDPARQSVVLTTHEVRWLAELWRPTDEAAEAVIEAAEEWAHDSTPETRLRLLVAVETLHRSAADEPGETP